jgi:hypothetical protein
MSREEFDENKQAILAAIDALMSNPKSRRRFRALALFEKTTGELLAEVFDTAHGRVVVHRSYGSVSRAGNLPFYRQGVDQNDWVVAPFTGDPVQRFHIVSGTGDRSVSGRDITQWLAEGKTRHTISQPTQNNRPLSETQLLAAQLAENVDAIAASPQAGEIYRGVNQMIDDIVRALNDRK